MTEYSKYKDCSPEQTVERVKGILDGLGITVTETWVENDVEGCYSFRVEVEGTGCGTNGKGTDKIHCLASGYAELLERLQPDFIYFYLHSPEVYAHEGFRRYPDEKWLSAAELAETDSAFTRMLFERFNCTTPETKETHAKNWIELAGVDDKIPVVPFYNVKERKFEELPIEAVWSVYGSNGMCAGNTPEEALVQGFSEIFERHVLDKIIKENIVPPEVPRDYLEKKYPAIYDYFLRIESGGRYKVSARDCSMGGKYPCAACVITDTETGTFGFKAGAHPSFAVALERCFTEAMQGKKLEYFASINAVADKKTVLHRDNMPNIGKTGNGYLHAEFFGGEPSYPFAPPKDVSGLSNGELLGGMLDILLSQGYDVLIRDTSYFGFPSYYIVVPGLSELFDVSPVALRLSKTYNNMQNDLNFGSYEARERLIKYIRFKSVAVLENAVPWIVRRPLNKRLTGSELDTGFLLLLAYFDNGLKDEAARQAAALAMVAPTNEKAFFSCVAMYLRYKSKELINALFKKETAQRVLEIFEGAGAVKAVLPQMPCWDCDKCKAPCNYPKLAEFTKKMKTARKNSGLTQEGLAKFASEIKLVGIFSKP